MLKEIHKKVTNQGRVIISVPIEIGFPSVVKNIRRMSLGNKSYGSIKNIFKCLFGIPVPEIRQIEGYIPSHCGFNHNELEKIIQQNFKIIRKETSPFKNLSTHLNSQIFYLLKKNSLIVC